MRHGPTASSLPGPERRLSSNRAAIPPRLRGEAQNPRSRPARSRARSNLTSLAHSEAPPSIEARQRWRATIWLATSVGKRFVAGAWRTGVES